MNFKQQIYAAITGCYGRFTGNPQRRGFGVRGQNQGDGYSYGIAWTECGRCKLKKSEVIRDVADELILRSLKDPAYVDGPCELWQVEQRLADLRAGKMLDDCIITSIKLTDAAIQRIIRAIDNAEGFIYANANYNYLAEDDDDDLDTGTDKTPKCIKL